MVTEKCGASEIQRDGGSRVVDTIQRIFSNSIFIMQFGPEASPLATWHFDYPFDLSNRFERRLANVNFIAEKIQSVEKSFTHIIFIHISMQFGLVKFPLRKGIHIWTFPMFLTPSYRASGEIVPESYFQMECLTLAKSENIVTPSRLEKQQLIEFYSIPKENIHVVPRGVDTQFLAPKVRSLTDPPIFCSIGSIKPQKNVLGLVQLFSRIHAKFKGAMLRIVGPVQDAKYYADVVKEIKRLEIEKAVEFFGYIPPDKLALAIKDTHMHISMSNCETFGRAIFETLALGLPNVAKITENAAAEFLRYLPYARFVDDEKDALNVIEEMLSNLSSLSAMAIEIGKLYYEEILSQLLKAKICSRDFITISDFDGTLFHKNDPERTQICIDAFRKFSRRVICSARSIQDLLELLAHYNLEVNWILGYSGAVVADGRGKIQWINPLDLNDVARLEKIMPTAKRIEVADKVLQISVPIDSMLNVNMLGLRTEIYQDTAFIADWKASKLRAVHQLLRYINWSGQVRVFGDGPYDAELINYFDGVFISSSFHSYNCQKEIINV